MKIHSIRTIAGPNIYHDRSVLVMTLDLESLAQISSKEISGFTERLVQTLPGIAEHRCSPGYPGGFVERLQRGTYFAHIIEHIALEMSGPAGIDVGYGKSIYDGREGLYKVIVRYKAEAAMKYLLEAAVDIAQKLVDHQSIDIQAIITQGMKLAEEEQLGPSTQAIVDAAVEKNIPWQRLNHRNLIQFGYGKNRKLIQASTTTDTSDISVDIAQDKNLTKNMLAMVGIPVPNGTVVYSIQEALEALTQFQCPLVVKPDDGHQGQGTTLHIMTTNQMRKAFDFAKEYSNTIVIEEELKGYDYRVVIVGNKMVAASRRVPAHVFGDGKSTILKLIEKENLNPLRGEGHIKPLTKIEIDESLISYLHRQGTSLDKIPEDGVRVCLRQTANLSTGGIAYDVTDSVHPDIQLICQRAARVIGLNICGVDIMAEDISLSPASQQIGIIEVNAGPGIRMHHYPAFGKPQNVGRAIIESMYPNAQDARIPIIAITGTNGKTTVTRMIAEMIISTDKMVGYTTSDGIYQNHSKIADGDTTGANSARIILCDPGIEVAVLETARGGIMRRGIGFDWCDVGVITNIQPDHIGQDGIETLDDILKVKLLIAERVRPGGTIVLNADDEALASIPETLQLKDRNIVFFSTQEANVVMMKHIAKGGRGFYVQNNNIVEDDGKSKKIIADVTDIPLTYQGTALFQISNVLASIAACRAYGMKIAELSKTLKSFVPNQHNLGRANLYRVRNGFFILDYGHNPQALHSISEMVHQWNVPRFTGVIAAPGDRSDEMIRMSGQIAAHAFDRVIVREDADLRNRKPGETASLLCGVISENPRVHCTVILSAQKAFERAVDDLVDDEVVAFFYDNFVETKEMLRRFDAVEITNLNAVIRKKKSIEFTPKKYGPTLQKISGV